MMTKIPYVERIKFDEDNAFITKHKPVSEVKIVRTSNNELIAQYDREVKATILTNDTDDFKSEITIINASDMKIFKAKLDTVLNILPKIKHKVPHVDINTDTYFDLSHMYEEGLSGHYKDCVFTIGDYFPKDIVKIRC